MKVEEAVTVKARGGRRQLQLLVALGGKSGRCSYKLLSLQEEVGFSSTFREVQINVVDENCLQS